MTTINLPHCWQPRPYQQPLWDYLKGGGKRGVAVWHRRAGKDDVALHHAACAAFERVGNYWHLLPEAAQARKAIWDAINPNTSKRRIDEAFPKELRSGVRNNEMIIQLRNGSTWQVVGSDNYNSLVGSPPVGLVFSEWALANPSAWAYLRPILRENGGWALFIYTPRGSNHGQTLYEATKDDPEWFAQKLPATQTGVFSKEQLDQELKEYLREFGKEDGESRFRQEYLCDFNIAVIGSYYGRLLTEAEDQKRIARIPHDPALKVDTWWDLGRADATAIWFVQHAGPEIHLIDYHSVNYAEPGDLARLLVQKRDERKFVYGRHIMPHDAGHTRLGMGGKSLSQMFYDLGFANDVQRPHDVDVGIVRVRQILPRCWFDREACSGGIDALRNYHKQWDEEKRIYSIKPVHDWSSHGSDAFRAGAMASVDVRAAGVNGRKRYEGRSGHGASGWAA